MKLERAPATLVGFYSRSDEGVFTHMGSKTHIHCVVDEPISAGHVDHVSIPTGTTVKFPAGANEGPNKQLKGTVTRHRMRAASAPLHYAPAARRTHGRAAAQLRRSAVRISAAKRSD